MISILPRKVDEGSSYAFAAGNAHVDAEVLPLVRVAAGLALGLTEASVHAVLTAPAAVGISAVDLHGALFKDLQSAKVAA